MLRKSAVLYKFKGRMESFWIEGCASLHLGGNVSGTQELENFMGKSGDLQIQSKLFSIVLCLDSHRKLMFSLRACILIMEVSKETFTHTHFPFSKCTA